MKKIKKLLILFGVLFLFVLMTSCTEAKKDINTNPKIEDSSKEDNEKTEYADALAELTKRIEALEELVKELKEQLANKEDKHIDSWKKGETIEGVKITYDLNDTDITAAAEKMEAAKKKVINEEDYNGLETIIREVDKYSRSLYRARDAEELLFNIYGKALNQEKYLKYSNAYQDYLQWSNEIDHMIYNSSFKALYYEEMTDEEIEEAIGKEKPQEYYDLVKEQTQIEADFKNLVPYSVEFDSKIDDLYYRYNKVLQQYSKYYDYDNYMDYAYDNIYARGYKKEQTDDYYQNVIKYVVPKYKEIEKEANKALDALTPDEHEIFNNIYTYDSFTTSFDYFENYVKYCGDFVEEKSNKLFKEGGRYYISYEKKSYDGAYTGSIYSDFSYVPMVYFGNEYHDLITVIHEFGHYMAACVDGDYTSYDVCETQSQANEYLFLEYMANYSNYDLSDNLKKAILYNRYADSYKMIVIASTMNEVEKECYKDEYERGEMVTIVNDIYESYPLLDEVFAEASMLEYAYLVTFDAPCYYISYSTSLIGALYIDRMAQDDFSDALTTYRKIVYNVAKSYSISEVYEAAGMKNPFTEEAFIYIFG